MNDPTYNKDYINSNPEWKLAFQLSEVDNDNAPLGWYKYIHMAKYLLNKYTLVPKKRCLTT